MIDVVVPFPGADGARGGRARRHAAREARCGRFPGVDYIYTTSSPNFAIAIVRFKVGQDPEESAVKLHTKLMAHPEVIPPGAGPGAREAEVHRRRADRGAHPVERALTTASQLRTVADEMALEIKKIPNISEVTVIGGERREISVALDPERLRGYGAERRADRAGAEAGQLEPAGGLAHREQPRGAAGGRRLRCAPPTTCATWWSGCATGARVRLGDVAQRDGRPGRARHVRALRRRAARGRRKDIAADPADVPAVTMAIAKKPGQQRGRARARTSSTGWTSCERTLLPATCTSPSPATTARPPQEKSNELILHVLHRHRGGRAADALRARASARRWWWRSPCR